MPAKSLFKKEAIESRSHLIDRVGDPIGQAIGQLGEARVQIHVLQVLPVLVVVHVDLLPAGSVLAPESRRLERATAAATGLTDRDGPDDGREGDEVRRVLGDAAEQLADARAHVALRVAEAREQLGDDLLPGAGRGRRQAGLEDRLELRGVLDDEAQETEGRRYRVAVVGVLG